LAVDTRGIVMNDVVYRTPRALKRQVSTVYHADRDCYHLADAVEVNEFPAEDARSLSVLNPCSACVDSGESDDRGIDICPECKGSKIRARVHVDKHERFHCYRCDATFRDPETRERSGNNHCRRGLAAELIEADAEEVSRDE
jgi:hypothetical protein